MHVCVYLSLLFAPVHMRTCCTHTHTHTHVYAHARAHTHTRIYLSIYLSIHPSIHLSIYEYGHAITTVSNVYIPSSRRQQRRVLQNAILGGVPALMKSAEVTLTVRLIDELQVSLAN